MAWPDAIALAALCLAGAWLWHASADMPQYDWQWNVLSDFLLIRKENGQLAPGLLLRGLFTTLRIGLWTIALSLVLGGLMGLMTARKSFLACLPATIFINLLRNTPPLVILFAVYFLAGNLLPIAGLEDIIRQSPGWIKALVADFVAPPGNMDRMIAAVLALGCYQAAYVAEITRGALEAVPSGQWDAALSLGFDRRAALRLVVLPQALRIMLPPLTGQCISTFKDSALAALISLPDLTFQSLEIMAVSNMTFELWITTAIIYLAIGLAWAALGRYLEYKLSRP